jgi:hypothetical protein
MLGHKIYEPHSLYAKVLDKKVDEQQKILQDKIQLQ